jgi:hypothetical protein
MILKKFNYSEFTDKPNSWSLDGLDLENINLLVGKNATGKTNTLTKIDWLGNMLAGRQPQLLNSGNYDVEFTTHDNKVYLYKLNLLAHNVEYEKLTIDDEPKFERGKDGKGQIFTAQFNGNMDFQLSPNQLVVTSKRDAIQHLFLEELVKWAEGQRMYVFGSNMGKDTFCLINNMSNINVDPRNTNSVISLYIKGEQEFPQNFRKRIIDSMKSIGYVLSDIGISHTNILLPPIPNAGNNGVVLYVSEKNSNATILQPDMSQGMFRALSLIIQITFNTLKRLPTTILIDDIGEGLDFDRSTKLINLLIELAEDSKYIQLIMSTNDRYVMNNVPFKYWQLIDRNGGKCSIYNYQNSKEIFDEFKYTGLNNFDFLATDFIHAEWEQK